MSNTLKLGNGQWATGKDTLLSFSDTNNNYKPLPFSFSRASSATVVNKDGLIETVGSGEPRIDFKDNTKGALLLEPQRTNNLPKSERLDQWSTASNATVEYGFPDPFGGNKAVKSTSSSTGQAYQIYLGFTSANTYNLSVYAKKGTAKVFRIDFGTRDNGYFSVNLETGESAGTSGFSGMINTKIEPLDNDWYRISLTSTTVNPNYVRMGAKNQEGFLYMAFAQLEEGSYPTSYIPTSGSAVTRVAESNDLPLQGYDLSSSFSLFLSFGKSFKTVQISMTILSIATSSNNFQLYTNSSGNDGINLYLQNQGGYVFNANANDGWNVEQSKICITYDSTSNRLVYFINGSIYGQQTSALNFGTISSGGLNANNNVFETREHKFYTNALTDAEAIALTS